MDLLFSLMDLSKPIKVYYSRTLSDRFSLGLGAMSTYAFGEQRLVPVIDLKYESKDEKFFAQVRFPKMTLVYQINPKFEIGFKAAQEGSEYNYRNISTPADRESDYIKFSSTNFGPTVSYNIFDAIHINSQVGVSTSRQLKIFDTANNQAGDLSPENSLFVSFGLVYALKR